MRMLAALVLFTLTVCCAVLCSCAASAPPSLISEQVTLKPAPDSVGTGGATNGTTSERVSLNGLWDFQGNTLDRSCGWQSIRVPGIWRSAGYLPGLQRAGDYARGFYRKKISMPAGWKGSQIFLKLDRVSTDARVRLAGKLIGDISWPSGELDITRHLSESGEVELLIAVASDSDPSKCMQNLGADDTVVPSGKPLSAPGLQGDVLLVRRKPGPRIGAIIVTPSVRQKKVVADVELIGVEQSCSGSFTVAMVDGTGRQTTLTGTASLARGDRQIIRLTGDCKEPKLWSPEHPDMYRMTVSVASSGITDSATCQFGFREFWIDQRKFMLNGQEIALRPIAVGGGVYIEPGWTLKNIEGVIDGYRQFGFNCIELWPSDKTERGAFDFNSRWLDIADRKGCLMIAQAPSAVPFVPSGINDYQVELYKKAEQWANHPSVILLTDFTNTKYGPSPNPLVIGRQIPMDSRERNEREYLSLLSRVSGMPAFAHGSFNLGDIFSLNQYFNFMPLQEREEFMSKWSKDGTMAYMAVEFGTPFICSFFRGRASYPQAAVTEPLLTEYSAIYLGKQAYELETDAYRKEIAAQFEGKQVYHTWHNNPILAAEPTFQQIQSLFIANTWRSWRSSGVTGGMVPWAFNLLTVPPVTHSRLLPSGAADQAPADAKYVHFLQPDGGWKLHPAASVLSASVQPVLAWICGAAFDSVPAPVGTPFESHPFYAKDHHFRAGQSITKQLAVVNDKAEAIQYSAAIKVIVDSKAILETTLKGELKSCQRAFTPFSFTLPPVSKATKGIIEAAFCSGAVSQTDRFEFTVYPASSKPSLDLSKVKLADPAGRTTKMFQQLGANVTAAKPLDPAQCAGATTVVLGREALSSGCNLAVWRSFVQSGGTLVCMSQNASALEALGFRVCRQIARRAYPVDRVNKLSSTLDESDLRDWTGFSDLKVQYEQQLGPGKEMYAKPLFAWHWGNRGGVSSAPVEKPHYGGWTPILETEFDLAYSPLMEVRFGKGRVILCCLDVEERAGVDPAAERFVMELMKYATSALPVPPRRVAFIGDESGKQLLNKFQVKADTKVDDKPEILIAGANVSGTDPAVASALQRGATVFFLPRSAGVVNGVTIANVPVQLPLPVGSSPWCRGISASDLHFRAIPQSLCSVVSGCDIFLGGLLGVKKSGAGTMVFCQLNPDGVPADSLTYLRLTRWRQARALAQVLANAGVQTTVPERLFDPAGSASLYRSDYIGLNDFILSDDPYRYYPW